MYDDIGRRDEEGGELGLYESIAGSLLNLSRSRVGSSMEVRTSITPCLAHTVLQEIYDVGVGDQLVRSSSSCTSQHSMAPHEVTTGFRLK